MFEIATTDSVTYSIRCSSEEREQFKDRMNKIIEANPKINNSSEALALAFQVYFTGTRSLSQEEATIAAQEIIDLVGCPWMADIDNELKCFEEFHKEKKFKNLGVHRQTILTGCSKCEAGKREQENKHIRKLLKGRTAKTFKQIINLLTKISKSGVPGTITFCNRLSPPIGTGMPTITCTKHDQVVEIDKVCKEPICKFLEQHQINIHSEFTAKALKQIEQIAEEYEQIEGPPIRKDVEAEQVKPDEPE